MLFPHFSCKKAEKGRKSKKTGEHIKRLLFNLQQAPLDWIAKKPFELN